MAKNDLAFATFETYRKILDSHWRPEIGNDIFEDVKYSRLAKIVDAKRFIKKKTHNNIVSVVRCAFEYGYRDHPETHNPASALKCFRLVKKDRRVPDSFTIHQAEALIAAIHRDWGEAQGDYDEFRFFTGLRPSEQIALRVEDCDLGQGKFMVNKARVMKRDKDRTKTGEDRIVELCPRARSAQASSRLASTAAAPGPHQSRGSLLPRQRPPDCRSESPLRPLALDSPSHAEVALSRALQRAPLLRELEPDAREEPALGREATRPQRADNARCLRRLDRGL